MSDTRIVTFTTDFGLKDPYVGTMHGVVLNIHPQTSIVDICHAVTSYDVFDGAWQDRPGISILSAAHGARGGGRPWRWRHTSAHHR